MATQTDERNSNKGQRKWMRWIVSVVVLLTFGWLAHFIWLRLTLAPEPRDEYWLAKIKDIDPAFGDTLSYDDVFDMLSIMSWKDGTGSTINGLPGTFDSVLLGPWDMSRRGVANASKFFESAQFMSARQKVIESSRKDWEIGFDPYDQIVRQCRDWAFVLTAHSRWALEKGDAASVREDWLTALRIGRQLRRMRTLVTYQREAEIQNCVAAEIIDSTKCRLPLFDSGTLEGEIRQIIGDFPSASELVEGDRYYAMRALDRVYVRQGSGWVDVPSAVREADPSLGVISPCWKDRLWNLIPFVFHNYEDAVETLEEKNRFYLNAKTIPGIIVERFEGVELGLSETDGISYLLNFFETNLYDEPFVEITQARMMLDAGIAMHAIERYAVKNGRWPESLDSLSPGYCQVPLDVVDGKPLRYMAEAEQYTLYSIWFDNDDDGGLRDDQDCDLSSFDCDWVFPRMNRNEQFTDWVVE